MQKRNRFTYLLLIIALVCEAAVFIIDVALWYSRRGNAVELEYVGAYYFKDILSVVLFLSLAMAIRSIYGRPAANARTNAWTIEPAKALWGGVLTVFVFICVALFLNAAFPKSAYQEIKALGEDLALSEQSVFTIVKSHLVALGTGLFALSGLYVIERLIFFRRSKNTRSNFLVAVGLMVISSLFMFGSRNMEGGFSLFFTVLAMLMMTANAFRLQWILSLSRRDKLRTLLLIPVLMIGGGIFEAVLLSSASDAAKTHAGTQVCLHAYSGVAGHFILLTLLFIFIYLATSFFWLLLHLPTSEAFEKKTQEMRSLYAMSRFITDVRDEEKIYDSLLAYTSGSSGATMSWLDIYEPAEAIETAKGRPLNGHAAEAPVGKFKTVSLRNINAETVHRFLKQASFVQQGIVVKKEIIQVDDLLTDYRLGKQASFFTLAQRRFNAFRKGTPDGLISSLVAVPLIARKQLIGALYVAKDIEYGFVKDDVEVISTFADQAAAVIDNSRLIKESIERERLQQELFIAQKIQLQLLPQSLPQVDCFDLDGISYPAYEVGGDYYDFVNLSEGKTIEKFGVVIADVSGKGTSAAFYMAELKGIFQSLSRIYPDSPKDLLIKANETLTRGLEKKAFVSVLYGVVDVATKELTLANAGHCPAILVSQRGNRVVRLQGMALGLDKGKIFNRNVSNETLRLETGDVVVFYTDGVLEAVSGNGEEFGFERLTLAIERSKHKCAAEIKADVFSAVNHFTEQGGSVNDDLTIFVIKAC
ncbi:MAG: SpoIIE family protein phosphatase [Rhizobacter sp.]|nr:SpoIIE family protein phosphatase [Chlorobiales bacterium]